MRQCTLFERVYAATDKFRSWMGHPFGLANETNEDRGEDPGNFKHYHPDFATPIPPNTRRLPR